jgi:hypothetical protein
VADRGKALESRAFTVLVTAAGGADKVAGYCASLATTPTDSATKPGGRPTDGPGRAPTDPPSNGGKPASPPAGPPTDVPGGSDGSSLDR